MPGLFELLAATANDEIYVLRPAGELVWVNDAACRSLGYSREALLALPVTAFSLSYGEQNPGGRGVPPGGDGAVFRSIHRTRDGRLVPKEVRAARFQFEGAPMLVAIARDISERIAAEAALADNEERFRSLFENTTVGMYRTTPAGRILLANPKLLEILGYDTFDDLARDDLAADNYHPDYRRSEFVRRIEAEGQILGLEATWRRRDRSWVYVRESARVVRHPDGSTAYYEGTVEDISEWHAAKVALQRSEQHYRGLFEHAHDAILVLDAERHVVIDANPAACDLYGYPREEFVGLPVRAYSMPDADIEARFREALTQFREYRFESRHRRRDGSTMELEIHATVIEHEGRQAILSMHRDLTARRDLEAQLHHGQKMEAVGRLAGGIAHDFNNLLTVISGHADLLLDLLGTEHPAYHHAEQVLGATRRGAAVARQLLTFSRRGVTSRAIVDLNAVITDVSPMLRTLIGEDVRLEIRPAGAPVHVDADPDQLEQVIVNMAVNARDAMPGGGVLSLRCAARAVNQGEAEVLGLPAHGDYVELRVADTGSGMAPEVAANIFEPFFTTKPPGTGTGLGLATAYGIVAQHGGVLAVDTRPGRGTTFTILLPHSRPVAVTHQEAAAPPAGGEGSETILLVEDDADVRRLAKTVLERRGYRVLEAQHGRAGLAVAAGANHAVDLVVSDVIMPGLGGPEMADALAERHPGLRVLFISGYTDRAREQLGSPGPGRAFLAKPFTPAELADAVRALIDAPAAP
jgi:PAS domain S-box-containing protein